MHSANGSGGTGDVPLSLNIFIINNFIIFYRVGQYYLKNRLSFFGESTMFMSILWESIFELKDRYPFMKISLIENYIPVLSFGTGEEVTLYLAGFTREQWQGSIVALKFFEDMMHSLKTGENMSGVNLSKAIFGKKISLIPCVCPKKMSDIESAHIGILPVAKYCSHLSLKGIYVIKSSGEKIYESEASGEFYHRAKQIGKVLSSCCNLPLVTEKDKSDEARFCTWAGSVLGVPSFSLELGVNAPSGIDAAYEGKKEMLLISALI